jgi:hypothetical protein
MRYEATATSPLVAALSRIPSQTARMRRCKIKIPVRVKIFGTGVITAEGLDSVRVRFEQPTGGERVRIIKRSDLIYAAPLNIDNPPQYSWHQCAENLYIGLERCNEPNCCREMCAGTPNRYYRRAQATSAPSLANAAQDSSDGNPQTL